MYFLYFPIKTVPYHTKPNLLPSFEQKYRKETHSYLDYCQFQSSFLRKLLTGYRARTRTQILCTVCVCACVRYLRRCDVLSCHQLFIYIGVGYFVNKVIGFVAEHSSATLIALCCISFYLYPLYDVHCFSVPGHFSTRLMRKEEMKKLFTLMQ